MKELMTDELTGDIVIFNTDRTSRPFDKQLEVTKKENIDKDINCPFCRGNEYMTKESLFAIYDEDNWLCRSVPNIYPLIDEKTTGIFGSHEVLIETHRHNGNFFDMSEKEFKNMFILYKNRYRKLSEEKRIKYIVLFKNFLRNAGASLAHPHSQIISMSTCPKDVEKEIEIAKEFFEKNSKSIYENIIEREIFFERRLIYSCDEFIIYVPAITKYNGEIRVFFRKNITLKNMSVSTIEELSFAFKKLFENFGKLNGIIPFNLIVHSHPIYSECEGYYNLHFHIIPRKFNFGGFELATGMNVYSEDSVELAEKLIIKEKYTSK